MQDAQNIDRQFQLTADAEQNDVPPPPPDMQRVQARADLIASLHRSDVRPTLQAGQHGRDQVPVRGSLGNAKPPRGPTQDVVVVDLSRVRQPDRPMAAPHSDDGPSTFWARRDKWVRSACPSAKLR